MREVAVKQPDTHNEQDGCRNKEEEASQKDRMKGGRDIVTSFETSVSKAHYVFDIAFLWI